LPKFDLIMLLSDIHDNGWFIAKGTLELMQAAAIARPKTFYASHKDTNSNDTE